tara:strand:- start:208 stop:636 length:429 start_codon:yes stop_codon:yes gene_type:complete
MIIDLNKKTVQELRQRCRELLDEGILDATRTEISRARKAELIEWIEFYDDDEDDLENESGLEHQIIAAKLRTAIESYPTENDFNSANPSTSEEETPLEPDNPEATEEISKSASKDAVREVLMLILVGLVTLAIAIGLGIYFR